jgi:hypothetical protein
LAFIFTKSKPNLRLATLATMLAGFAMLSLFTLKADAQGSTTVTGTVNGNTTPVPTSQSSWNLPAATGTTTLTQTATIGGTSATAANGSIYIEVPTYNPAANAYGQLTSVTLTFNGTAGANGSTATGSSITYGVERTGSVGSGKKYYITGEPMTLTLFTPTTAVNNGSTVTALPSGTSSSSSVPTFTTASITMGQTSFDTPLAYSGFSTGSATNAQLVTATNNLAVWSGYTGASTMYFDVYAALSDQIMSFNGSAVDANDLSSWLLQSSVAITYSFGTPEPGAWGLLAGCAAACGISLRRRRLRARRGVAA